MQCEISTTESDAGMRVALFKRAPFWAEETPVELEHLVARSNCQLASRDKSPRQQRLPSTVQGIGRAISQGRVGSGRGVCYGSHVCTPSQGDLRAETAEVIRQADGCARAEHEYLAALEFPSRERPAAGETIP
jgi:hypothetical protein